MAQPLIWQARETGIASQERHRYSNASRTNGESTRIGTLKVFELVLRYLPAQRRVLPSSRNCFEKSGEPTGYADFARANQLWNLKREAEKNKHCSSLWVCPSEFRCVSRKPRSKQQHNTKQKQKNSQTKIASTRGRGGGQKWKETRLGNVRVEAGEQ